MSPNPPRGCQLPGSRTGMHRNRLPNDKAIGHKFSDRLAGIGVGDFAHFVGVKPYFALSTSDDRGGEALLGAKIDPRLRERGELA